MNSCPHDRACRSECTLSTISGFDPDRPQRTSRQWLTAISAPSNPFSASSSSSIEARSRWLVGSSSSRRNGGCGRAKTQASPRAQPLAAGERAARSAAPPGCGDANRASAAWASLAGKFRIEAAQIVENARAGIEQADMLIEHGNAVGEAADVAARRLQFAGDQAEQGGLAAAVGAAGSAIRSGPRTSNDSGPNRWRSPKAITTSLNAISSRPPGRWVRGKSIDSGVGISTCALAISSASVRSPSRRPASLAFARGAVLGALLLAVHEHLVLDALGAPGAAGLVAARLLLRAFCSARSVLRKASEARSRSSAARARAASRASAKADHPPPNMLMPIGVSSTMRSTRSSSARSWLATRTPPCQRSSNCATACRPSASRLLVGLVQQQQIRRLDQEARQRHAAFARRRSARRSGDRSGKRRQSSFDQRRLYPRFQRPVRLGRVIERTFAAFEPVQAGKSAGDAERFVDRQPFIGQLRQHADRADALQRSACGLDLARDQAQQCGFAAAVAADKAGALAPEWRASIRRTAGVRQA